MKSSDIMAMIYCLLCAVGLFIYGIILIIKSKDKGRFADGLVCIIFGITVMPAVAAVSIAGPFFILAYGSDVLERASDTLFNIFKKKKNNKT